MLRNLVTAALTLGLLASSDPCAWVCQTDATPTAVAETASHCAGRDAVDPAHRAPADDVPGAPVGPDAPDGPAHEGCPSCGDEIAVASAPVDAPGTGSLLALVRPHLLSPAGASRAGAALRARPAGKAPPRDILAITTSLRL